MSTFSPSNVTQCPNKQAMLNDFYNNCGAAQLIEPAPLAEFELSPLNTSGVQKLSQQLIPGPGKKGRVELVYYQRLPESVVENKTDCDKTCTATNEIGDGKIEVEMDICDREEANLKMNADDFILSCRGNGQLAAERLSLLMDAVVRKTYTRITNRAIGNIGKWATNVQGTESNAFQILDIATLKPSSTTDFNPFAMVKLKTALMKTGYCAPPVMFAGETFYNYMQALSVGCCASDGLNLLDTLRKFGQAVMYDMRVENNWTADGIFITQPGAQQVVFWDPYAGGREMNAALNVGPAARNYETFTLFHPRSGMPINFLIKDECPGELHIIASTTADVFAMPTDMFPSGDRMTGVVFSNRAKVVNS